MMRTRTNKFVLVLLSLVAVIMMMAAMTGFVSSGSNVSATDEISLTVQEGASIKLDADNTGIRFTVNVSKGLSTAVIDDAEGDAEVGVAVMPSKILNEFEAQKVNGETDLFYFIKVTYGKDKEVISQPYGTNVLSKTEDVELYGRIVGIKDENYNSAYKAVAYYTLDGENYVYSNYSGERTIAQVAFDYLNDDPATEDIAGLKEILAKATNLNGGELDGSVLNAGDRFITEDIDLTATFAKNLANPTYEIVSGAEYVTINGTTLSPVSTGTAIINVSADGISYDVKVSAVKGSVLADYSSELYEDTVTLNQNSLGDGVSATYLAEKTDGYGTTESGVLEIKTKAFNNTAGNQAGFILLFPKAATGKNLTIRMMIAAGSTALGFKVGLGTQQLNDSYNVTYQEEEFANSWFNLYVEDIDTLTYQGADKIGFIIWAGEATEYTVYVSHVIDSDVYEKDLADNLTGYNLADYSDDSYENLVYPTRIQTATNIKTSIVDNFNGENNVLKVEATSSGVNHATQQDRGMSFALRLPKASTDGKVIMKIYYTSFPAGFRTMNQAESSAAADGASWSGVSVPNGGTGVINQWQTIALDYGTPISKIPFMIWATTGTFTMYVSYVKQNIDLTENLGENVLADFSNDVYETLIVPNANSKAGSITVEYLDGETNNFGIDVIKVETKQTASQWWTSGFAIKLPKAAQSDKVRVWMYIKDNSPAGFQFVQYKADYAEEYAEETANTTQAIPQTTKGSWFYVDVDMSKLASKDKICIHGWENGGDANKVYTYYFAIIYDGANGANKT